MRRKRVLYIISSFDIGGAERQLIELLRGIDQDTFEPIVCCVDREGSMFDEVLQTKSKTFVLYRKRKIDIKVLLKLIKLIKLLRPEIVHTWLFLANLYGRIAARIAKVPIVIASERGTGYSLGKLQSMKIRLFDQAFSWITDTITANAIAVRKYLVSKKISDEKIEVIYNGINLEKLTATKDIFIIRNEFDLKPIHKVVGIIARFDPDKDYPTFFRMAKLIKERRRNVKFLVIGDGILEKEIELLIKENSLETDVILTGFRNNIPELLSIMDVFVLTSIKEGFSNAILEAMALKKPVVVTDVGGNSEAVSNGKTGFIVSARDYNGLADKTIQLLDDPHLSVQMGDAGRMRIEKLFTVDMMVKKMEQLYIDLICHKSWRLNRQTR